MIRMGCYTCEHNTGHQPHCIACIKAGEYVNYELSKEIKEKEETEMAVETKIYTHEKMVEVLKKCGQSIIENAESIVGHESYLKEVRVTVHLNPSEAATINVDRDFYPEGIIK